MKFRINEGLGMPEFQGHYPVRIQRRRAKGWRLPANSKCVTRPGRWGNPFRTAEEFEDAMRRCAEMRCVPDDMDFEKGQRILWMLEHLDQIRGVNLACFCGSEKPCHADVLLKWANSPQ